MINIHVENKKFLYQVVLFIILSNLIVYLLSIEDKKDENLNVPSNYSEIITSLNLFTPYKKYKKVLLSDDQKRTLIKDVYLIKKINVPTYNTKEALQYVIKIDPKYLNYFTSSNSNILNAYPSETQITYKAKQKRRSYEIFY